MVKALKIYLVVIDYFPKVFLGVLMKVCLYRIENFLVSLSMELSFVFISVCVPSVCESQRQSIDTNNCN